MIIAGFQWGQAKLLVTANLDLWLKQIENELLKNSQVMQFRSQMITDL